MLVQMDYVRLHGYEFHLFTSVVDKSLTKLCVSTIDLIYTATPLVERV